MANSQPDPPPSSPTSSNLESTASLLRRVRDGDPAAKERLIARYLPILRRWAHGRLPTHARDLVDTDDLVQVTLFKTLDHLKEFETRREGAFLAYLRRILVNQIRDEIRRADRAPRREHLPENLREPGPSPLEVFIGRERLQAYEKALAKLPAEQQEAVILRIEFGFTHRELAESMGSPSANAARMTVARALVRLAEVLDEQE